MYKKISDKIGTWGTKIINSSSSVSLRKINKLADPLLPTTDYTGLHYICEGTHATWILTKN